LRSSNAEVRRRAAIEGLGAARITASFCADAVRAGQLRALLPDYRCAPLRIYALLPGQGQMPLKLRLFLDLLSASAPG
jgi:DNA-binding transcriptional LysR family regulator